jgi:hypothetical protein
MRKDSLNINLKTEEFSWFFLNLCNTPENFLFTEDSTNIKLRIIIKQIFDCAKSLEPKNNVLCPIEELIIKDFNSDQIWEELKLMNVRVLNFLRKKYKTLELINKKKTLTENADSTKTLADVQKGKKESYSLKSVVNTQSEEINSQTKIKEKKILLWMMNFLKFRLS